MRILVFTTLFPNTAQPRHGVFVENRLRAFLRRHDAEVVVVAPAPWFPFDSPIFGRYARYAAAPHFETRDGVRVVHPRYPVVPKVGMRLAPDALARTLAKSLDALAAEGWVPDLLDAHYLYPDGVAAARVARARALPLVLTARGSDVTLLADFPGPRRDILAATKSADAVITVAEALRARLIAIGAAPEKIRTLRNGVDLDRFRLLDRDAIRRRMTLSGEVFAFVGQLIERKGVDIAIDAMRDRPDATLLVVGEGPMRKALQARARAACVAPRVRFVGPLPHEALADIYNAADALLLPSAREGWPNVLLEAMACGAPAIATDAGGVREVISAPAAGIVASHRSAEALGAAIAQLMAAPPPRTAVRAHAEAHSWDATADGMAAVFRALAAKTARRRAVRTTPLPAPAGRPRLVVTVDAEELFDWSRWPPRSSTLPPVADIARFQDVCDKNDAAPLYFLSYPLLADARIAAFFRRLVEEGRAACGLHLHTWSTPPYSDYKDVSSSFQANLSDALYRQKLSALATAFETAIGARAIAHRAGRYGIRPDSYAALAAQGVRYDFSPAPGFDFSPAGGPDFAAMSARAFRITTPEGDVAVFPVSGARARRGTRRFPPRRVAPGFTAGLAAPWFTAPARLSPEGNDPATLTALTRRLIADGADPIVFTLHSSSLTVGANPYGRTPGDVDRILMITDDYLRWFRKNLSGCFLTLDCLDARVTAPSV